MYKLTPLDRKRGLRIPEMSEALAEIIGIHFGDGTMEDGAKGPAATYTIGYAMDARRPNYTEFVKNIFYDTFHITFHSYKYKSKQCIVLYYRSKTICTFFNRELKVPYGKKTDLQIPTYILMNDAYLAAFLRGMFDTDGCYITQRDKGYIYNLLKFTTKHHTFAIDIHQALEQLGMRTYICSKKEGYDVMIRNAASYQKFMNIIKPRKEKLGLQRFEL